MQVIRHAFRGLQSRLIGIVGVGSICLIFLSGLLSDIANESVREDEQTALSALENVAQARYEIALLGVAGTRYLDTLAPDQKAEIDRLRTSISARVDSIASLVPEIAASAEHKALTADIAAYSSAFQTATETKQSLGTSTAPGLRDDFMAALDAAAASKAWTTAPALATAGMDLMRHAGQLLAQGGEPDGTALLQQTDIAIAAADALRTRDPQSRLELVQILRNMKSVADKYVTLQSAHNVSRQTLRDISRTTSVNFLALSSRISQTRNAIRNNAASSRHLITSLNVAFSLAVALGFILLARAIGLRIREQSEAITSSEARFRKLVETVADFAVETDAKLLVKQFFMNPAFAPEVVPSSLIGRPVFSQPNDNEHTIALDEKLLQSYLNARATFRNFDYLIKSKDGRIAWRRCYGAPYFDDQGHFAGYRILSQDITAQKQTEWHRNEADAAYRAIATASFGAFYRIDKSGRIISLEGIRGQPSHIMHIQRPGRLIWDAMVELGIRYPDHVDLKACVLEGKPFDEVEIQIHRSDGSVRGWYLHRGVPIRDPSGNATGYVIAIANVSQQKLLEIQARAKAEELERIIATMPGAFFRLSGSSPETATLEFMSPGIESILGFKPGEIVNKPGLDLTVPGEREHSFFAADSASAMQEKRLLLRRKDGSTATVIEKPVEIDTLPDGRKIVEGLLIDISDLAQRDQEITERRRQLEAVVGNLPGWVYGLTFKNGVLTDTFCAGATERLTGYKNSELAQLLFSDPVGLTHPDDAPGALMTWNRIRTASESGTYDIRARLISRHNQQIWISDRGTYTCEPDGTIYVDGIIIDVTGETSAQIENDVIKSAVDSASDVICVLDQNEKIIYANQAFRKFAELPAHASLQNVDMKLLGRFVSPDNATYRKTAAKALRETGRYRAELDWESPSKRRRRLDMTVTRTAEGHFVMIVRDVTAIRSAAERRNRLNMAAARVGIARGGFLSDFRSGIQELTQIAANALDVAQVGVWLFNDEGRQSYTAIDVYDRRIDRHSEGMVHHRKDYPLYFAALDLMRNIVAHDAANDPITREFKSTYLEPQGITGLLDTPIFRGGKVLGVLCVERDGPVRKWLDEEVAFATVIADSIAFGIEAEERKVAERRVVAVNSQLNRVVKALDSSRDNIIVEDESGHIAYMNARAAQNAVLPLNGRAIGNGQGIHFAELFPNFARKREDAAAQIQSDLNTHGAWEDTLDFTLTNGRRVQMTVRLARLADGGHICVATDITDRRRQEEQEAALRLQLAEAQKMEAIGRLAGGIAHDFNNIIAAVAAYASVMTGDSCSNPQHISYAQKIKAICGRASDIVKQILLFAKAKTANHEAIALSGVIDEARDLLRTSLPTSIDVRVIERAPAAVVNGAASQLLQVLLNLGLNSGDAIGEKQGSIEITLDQVVAEPEDAEGSDMLITRQDGDVTVYRSLRGSLMAGQTYARISVRDDGPGIPKEVLERIYEPFFSTKEKSKGTGLGIPVVHSIVTAHDGAIEIRSALGHGAQFLIYLPLSTQQTLKPEESQALPPVPCRGRILIVDDETDLADAMSILLSKAGFEAAPVYSPEEAIDLFAEDPYAWDLVLTDQVMPKMKGVALAKRLLKLRPNLPIILHTGYSDSASEEVVKAAGIRTLLYKPVEGAVLIQHISSALKSVAR